MLVENVIEKILSSLESESRVAIQIFREVCRFDTTYNKISNEVVTSVTFIILYIINRDTTMKTIRMPSCHCEYSIKFSRLIIVTHRRIIERGTSELSTYLRQADFQGSPSCTDLPVRHHILAECKTKLVVQSVVVVVIREPRCVTEGLEGDNPEREGREVERRVKKRVSVTMPLANSAMFMAKVHFLESRLAVTARSDATGLRPLTSPA